MNKKIEVCHEFMNKLLPFFGRNDRSFMSYIVDVEKFSVKFFYDKRKFHDIDAYVDEFLKELQNCNLSQHGWFTEDWLISEIGGDPSDATYFDILVVVTVFQKQRAKEI